MKNCLFSYISDNFTKTHVELFMQKYNPEKAYVIYDGDTQKIPESVEETYNFWQIIYGNYDSNIIDLPEYMPLDDTIINMMNPYSLEILQMIGRMGIDSYERKMELYLRHLEFWYNMLIINKIEYVVFGYIPHEVFDYIIYKLCIILNIKTCMMSFTPMLERWTIIKKIDESDKLLSLEYDNLLQEYKDINIDDINLPERAQEYFENMKSKKEDLMVPVYVITDSRKGEFKRRFGFKISDVYKRTFDKENHEKLKPLRFIYSTICQIRQYQLELKKDKELEKSYKNSISEMSMENDTYIYFPLHYQPECTSSPQGGGIYDRMIIPIKILSHNIPDDFYIYVKEYPIQTHFGRNKEVYEELKKIPKVKIVPTNTNSYKLIEHAWAVSTLTGTAGWEAQFYGKPFLMFGHYVTQYAPLTYHIRTNDECKAVIRSLLEKEPLSEENLYKQLKLFVYALYNRSFNLENDPEKCVEFMGKALELCE